MKRTFIYVVGLFIMTMATSCVEVTPIKNLKLSTSEVTVEVKGDVTFTIESGSGDYRLVVADESISTATFSGTTVVVEGLKEGENSVTVIDKVTDQQAKVKVEVTEMVERIIFVTTKAIGEQFSLGLQYYAEDIGSVWVDVNNNGVKDEGEGEINHSFFGYEDVGEELEHPSVGDRYKVESVPYKFLVESQTVTIYGKITRLRLDDSGITSLDLSKSKMLKSLLCSKNKLATLDVNHLTELITLDCSDNELTTLDVNGLVKLRNLSFGENNIASIEVSKLQYLELLTCSNNKLTSLDVKNLKILQELRCEQNQLSSLYIGTELKALYLLSCYENKLQGNAMVSFLESLPSGVTQQGLEGISIRSLKLKTDSDTEGNDNISSSQISEANRREWAVYFKEKGSWKRFYQPHPGSPWY